MLPTKQEFKYLGIVFQDGKSGQSSTGGAYAQQLQGAKQALHSMWRRCYDLGIRNVRTLCYLFDALVRPIMSYGCEVWAPDIIHKCMSKGVTSAYEALHNSFMRQMLGVRDSTPVHIMLHELDRLPIWMFWLCQCIRFWNKTVELPNGDLLKSCLLQNWAVSITSPHSASRSMWTYYLCNCLMQLGLIKSPNELAEKNMDVWQLRAIDMDDVQDALQEHLDRVWSSARATSPRAIPDSDHVGFKIAVYGAWFKPEGGIDKRRAFTSYLSNPQDITNVARFRMGSHNLFIESMRWGKDRLPRSLRKCCCCNLGVVEDEVHFLLECPMYAAQRSDLQRILDFPTGAPVDNCFRQVVDCSSQIQWRAFATYIRNCLKLRDDVLIGLGVK